MNDHPKKNPFEESAERVVESGYNEHLRKTGRTNRFKPAIPLAYAISVDDDHDDPEGGHPGLIIDWILSLESVPTEQEKTMLVDWIKRNNRNPRTTGPRPTPIHELSDYPLRLAKAKEDLRRRRKSGMAKEAAAAQVAKFHGVELEALTKKLSGHHRRQLKKLKKAPSLP